MESTSTPAASPTPAATPTPSSTPVVSPAPVAASAPAPVSAAGPDYSEKSYKALQSFATKSSQEAAELRKNFNAILDALKPPHDPEAFLDEIKMGGAPALEKALKGRFDALEQSFQVRLASMEEKTAIGESQTQVYMRLADPVRYPDFAALVPEMQRLLDGDTVPVNPNLPTGQYLDALYNLARTTKGADAVKAAREAGRLEVDSKLRAEAAVASPGNGQRAVPSAKSLSLADMEAMLRKQGLFPDE